MKYVFRFFMFLLFCGKWVLLPVFAFLVNLFAILWWCQIPSNGWFKLERDDWFWLIGSIEERSINIISGRPNYYYKTPWELLINKKTKF